MPAQGDFSALALSLASAIGDFTFQECDRYDEVPAYEAKHDGMRATIFGVPAGEGGHYVLQLQGSVDENRLSDLKGFMKILIRRENPANSNGYTYYSEELADCLRRLGFLDWDVVDR